MRRFATLVGVIASLAAWADETPLEIESSTGSSYFVVEQGGTEERPEMVLKRVRRSGATSYFRNLYDCETRSARQLNDAESLEALGEEQQEGEMAPVEEGTVSWQLWKHACGK